MKGKNSLWKPQRNAQRRDRKGRNGIVIYGTHKIIKEIEYMGKEKPKKTHLFIKCLEYQYAKAFIDEGAIRFAMPSEWKPDGTSRGDNLEGVYVSLRGFDPVLDGLLKALRKDVVTEKDGDLTFYKSKEVTSYRAYCMYGVNDTCVYMHKQRSQDHRYHEGGVVRKEYFRNLFPKVTPENVEKLDEKNKPAALFIKPDNFINLLTTKLMEMGVKKEEIIIGPIAYMDYFQDAFHVDRKPMELFCKHVEFEEQNEIRIVIDTRREEVRKLFENNGIIKLGPIDEKIAALQETYFEDVTFEIRENKLLFPLAKPIQFSFDELGDDYFLRVMAQALADELPNAPMTIEEIEKWLNDLLGYLQKRDSQATYDKNTNILSYKGTNYDLGAQAGVKMLEHYNNYVLSGDIKSAGEVYKKFKHFFPSRYVGDQYFSAYLKTVREM